VKDHIQIEELYAARALGGLDPEDAAELERAVSEHGDECPECSRLRDEYAEVGGLLAFALDPADVPDGMDDRILGRARLERRSLRMPRRVAAALAAAALLGAGVVGGYLLAPRTVPGLSDAAAYLSQPGARIASLEGTGSGRLVMAYRPGRQDAYLIGSSLSPAPEGKVYELWLIEDEQASPAAVFTPEGDLVVVPVPSDPSTADQAAVTLEQVPGAEQPTTAPIYAAPITSS